MLVLSWVTPAGKTRSKHKVNLHAVAARRRVSPASIAVNHGFCEHNHVARCQRRHNYGMVVKIAIVDLLQYLKATACIVGFVAAGT